MLQDGWKWMWNDVRGLGNIPGQVLTNSGDPIDDLAASGHECAPPYTVDHVYSFGFSGLYVLKTYGLGPFERRRRLSPF